MFIWGELPIQIMKYINKIAWANTFQFNQKPNLDFEVIVKQKGEIIYQSEVYGGVFSVVEKITSLIKFEIEATTQRLIFGHQNVALNAFDMLNKDFKSYLQKALKLMGLKDLLGKEANEK